MTDPYDLMAVERQKEEIESLKSHNKLLESAYTGAREVLRASELELQKAREQRDDARNELEKIDQVLARRPALASATTRVEKIERCVAVAKLGEQLQNEVTNLNSEIGRLRDRINTQATIIRQHDDGNPTEENNDAYSRGYKAGEENMKHRMLTRYKRMLDGLA